MYIPEFWCGVGATIILEIIFLIIYSIFIKKGERKNVRKQGESDND